VPKTRNYLNTTINLSIDETLPNLIKRKHPKKGREKKTGDKDQNLSKQASNPNEVGHKRGNH
jgi:hypothetical protein